MRVTPYRDTGKYYDFASQNRLGHCRRLPNAKKSDAAVHSKLAVGGQVILGFTVSDLLITCVQVSVLPEQSVAVHKR